MKIKTEDGEELEVQFADSFFDKFDGTDEELQELIQILTDKIKDGSLFEEAELIDEQELDDEEAEMWSTSLKTNKHTLQ